MVPYITSLFLENKPSPKCYFVLFEPFISALPAGGVASLGEIFQRPAFHPDRAGHDGWNL